MERTCSHTRGRVPTESAQQLLRPGLGAAQHHFWWTWSINVNLKVDPRVRVGGASTVKRNEHGYRKAISWDHQWKQSSKFSKTHLFNSWKWAEAITKALLFPFKWSAFVRSWEGVAFIHPKEVSHLGLAISPLETLASLFYTFQIGSWCGDSAGEKPASQRVERPHSPTYDLNRGTCYRGQENPLLKRKGNFNIQKENFLKSFYSTFISLFRKLEI